MRRENLHCMPSYEYEAKVARLAAEGKALERVPGSFTAYRMVGSRRIWADLSIKPEDLNRIGPALAKQGYHVVVQTYKDR